MHLYLLNSPNFLRRLWSPLLAYYIAFGFACWSVHETQAQTRYTLSGYIQDAAEKELLPGVTIYISALKTGTTTNLYGFYSLTLPAGTYQVQYSYVGFGSVVREVVLDGNKTLSVLMQEEAVQLETVEVLAEDIRQEIETAQTSLVAVTPKEVEDIPAFLGEKDVIKVIQLLPGVQSGAEGSSGLYVRGGGPDQNLIILDDAIVYNASHLFGFFSTFNGDAVKSVELYKGGFPARFGGRLSSVINLTMKDGNKEELHGKAGVGVVSSQLVLEGPLRKQSTSFLFSGRRTYIDALIQPILPKGTTIGYFFHDFNAKINHVFSEKDKLYLSAYYGLDQFYTREKDLDYSFRANFGWGNIISTLRWNHQWSRKAFSNTSLIFSRYNLSTEFHEEFREQSRDVFDNKLAFSSSILNYTLKHDLDFFPLPSHSLKAGGLVTVHRFAPNTSSATFKGGDENWEEGIKDVYYGYEAALYVEDEIKWGRFLGNIGIRGSAFRYKDQYYMRPEPRVALGYKLNSSLTLKTSYAAMNQYLHRLSRSGAQLPSDLWVSSTNRIKPQNAQQFVIGGSQYFENPALLLSVEGYYKWSQDVLIYKEAAQVTALPAEPGGSATSTLDWQDQVTNGRGWAYGVEFLLRRNRGKFSGWIGYTLAWTKQQFDDVNHGITFFPRHDRRHDLSVVGTYKLNPNYTFSAVWVYGTGYNLDLRTHYTVISKLNNSTSGNTRDDANSAYVPLRSLTSVYAFPSNLRITPGGEQNIFTEKFNFRAIDYHRLDLSVQFHKEKPKRRRAGNNRRTWEVGAYNAYNRKNAYWYNLEQQVKRVPNPALPGTTLAQTVWTLQQYSLVPMVPYVGFRYEF